jgi:ariadne-1
MASGDDSDSVGGESSRYKRHDDGDCLEDDGESGSHSGSSVSGDCCSDDEDDVYYYEYDDDGSDYGDISDAENTKVEAAAPSP